MQQRIFSVILYSALFGLGLVAASDSYCSLDTDKCRCVNKSGDGFGVDLGILKGRNLTDGDYVLSICDDSHWVPKDVTGQQACIHDGYSLCWIHRIPDANKNTTTNTSVVLAHNKEWSVEKTHQAFVELVFNQTTVRLICTTAEDVEPRFVVDSPTLFSVYSTAGCIRELEPHHVPEGLGTGAIISIIILVTFFCYFVLGAGVNYFMMGARGAEICPHYEFWSNLPSLVRDGARFLQNGCRPTAAMSPPRESYDSI